MLAIWSGRLELCGSGRVWNVLDGLGRGVDGLVGIGLLGVGEFVEREGGQLVWPVGGAAGVGGVEVSGGAEELAGGVVERAVVAFVEADHFGA